MSVEVPMTGNTKLPDGYDNFSDNREYKVRVLLEGVYGEDNVIVQHLDAAVNDENGAKSLNQLAKENATVAYRDDEIERLAQKYVIHVAQKLCKAAQNGGFMHYRPASVTGIGATQAGIPAANAEPKWETWSDVRQSDAGNNFVDHARAWMKRMYGADSEIVRLEAEECDDQPADLATVAWENDGYPNTPMHAPLCAMNWLIGHAIYVFNNIGYDEYMANREVDAPTH